MPCLPMSRIATLFAPFRLTVLLLVVAGLFPCTAMAASANEKPTLTTVANPTASFLEGDGAVALFSSTAIDTVEAGQNIHALTLTVLGLADGGAEILTVDGTAVALTDTNNVITASNGYTVYVAVSGVTATVTITKAGDYSTTAAQALVDGLGYRNTSDNPTVAGGRIIILTSIQDDGGTANGGVDTATLNIDETVILTAINDVPVVVSDSGSSAFMAGDNMASTPVVVDGGLTVSDPDNVSLASATVAITGGFYAGQDVLAFTNDGATMGNITASYNASTGVMTLTSAGASATLAQWQAALRSVTYTDTAITPDTATRTVSFSVNDGDADSAVATRTITVTATDQTPIVTTTGGTTNYVFGTASVTIDGGIVVSDLDNTTQSSATVSIGAGFHSGDVLGFTNDGATMGNIVASYNAATGVMTLTSSGATATNSQWARALSSVTFSSTSSSNGNRTIAFSTNDGVRTSAVATDTVNVLGLPKVTNVSSTTPDGSYKVGDTITLTVTFDQVVVVNTAGGTPTLQLETGSVDHDAIYASGSGTDTLAFAFIVQAGDVTPDLDYASTSALALAGATIHSNAGIDAVLTLPATGGASSIAGQHAIIVDGIAPTVIAVDVPADGTYFAGQNLDFTINYSEAVTVDTSGGTPRIAITLDTGGPVYADYLSGSGTTALVFRYTVAAGQADPNGIALAGVVDGNGGSVRDGANNDAVATLNGVAATSGVLVGKTDQAITFGAQAGQIFAPGGTFLLDPLATASSGLPVSYSSQTTGVCTIAGNTVTMLTAGTCTIAADQAGDAAYNPAPTVAQPIAIGVAGQTITFGVQVARTFAPGGTFVLDPLATASSGLPVGYSSQTPGVCTIAGSTVTMLTAGTCTIAADQAGDANYAAAPTVTRSIAIGVASQTITFGAQAARTFAPGGTFVLDPLATASSGLPVVYSSQTTGVCTIAGSTVTMLAAGTCTIAADQAGDASYSAAPTVVQSIAIGKAAQAITGFAANPETPTFAPNGTFTVSASGGGSGNPVLFASTTAAVCSVGGDVVTMRTAGTCRLTADQAGDGNYTAAPQQVLEVAIAKATPTLAWIEPLQKIVGEPAFDLPDPNSDSSGTFAFTSSDPTVATVDGRRVTIVGPGTTTLVATQAATRDYTDAAISTELTVTARPDPTRDPEVIGTIQGQLDASLRFAAAQQRNIGDRLRQLRAGRGTPSSNSLSLSYVGAGGGLALPLGSQAGTRRLFPAGVWAAGTITIGRRDSVDDSGSLGFRSDGVTVGIDRAFGEHMVLGVAGGYGWSDTDTGEESTLDGSQRSLAAYGLWRGSRHLFVDGMLGVGDIDFDIARWSGVAADTAHARRGGHQLFGTLTFGYEHAGEHLTLTSYGRYEASRTTLDAYAESGLGIYDLRYGRQTMDDSGVALGIEGRHRFATPSADWRPYWLVEYRSALQSRSDVGINYVVQPVASDYVLSLRNSFDDALSVGAGLEVDLPRDWQLALQFRHEQAGSNRAESYGLQLSWGKPATMSPTVVEAQLQDPREAGKRAPWQRQP